MRGSGPEIEAMCSIGEAARWTIDPFQTATCRLMKIFGENFTVSEFNEYRSNSSEKAAKKCRMAEFYRIRTNFPDKSDQISGNQWHFFQIQQRNRGTKIDSQFVAGLWAVAEYSMRVKYSISISAGVGSN
jgi:hypothetical protein